MTVFLSGIISDVIHIKSVSNTCFKGALDAPTDTITWLGPPNDMAYIVGLDVDASHSSIEVNVSNNRSVLCITKVSNKHSYEADVIADLIRKKEHR